MTDSDLSCFVDRTLNIQYEKPHYTNLQDFYVLEAGDLDSNSGGLMVDCNSHSAGQTLDQDQ